MHLLLRELDLLPVYPRTHVRSNIEREDAEDLAAALKQRAVRELEEAIAVRDRHEPRPDADGVVVHDSEGPKRPDGTPLDSR